jgi:murein peptide amidase A
MFLAALLSGAVLLGHSVDGRPVRAFEVGDPKSPDKELVVGCIHGNEAAGIAIARWLEHRSPAGVDLWIVPDLNPDGRGRGTRGNAHGVDLNRNFPFRWRPLAGQYDSGVRPLSEPESRIAYRLIRKLRPRVSIWFHQHRDAVDESGGSASIERSYAVHVGLPLVRLIREPGSVVGWENHVLHGSTAFVVELPRGRLSHAATVRYGRAVISAGRR